MTTLKNIHAANIYRPDIDGLRAIAIIAVLGFHFFPDVIRGGFIGVDVFFVISGYLITNIIHKQFVGNAFSFINFYARRARRLFPALIIVFVICIAYGWFALFPLEFETLGGSIYYGTLSIANFFFYRQVNYFDIDSTLKPFLHLWSLAIEEQFYFISPILFYIFHKKGWQKYLLRLMIFTIVISFSINIFFYKTKLAFSYFLPYTRFWEIALGSLLALQLNAKKIHNQSISPLWRNLMSVIGIIEIGIGAISLDSKNPYPGWAALLPCTGVFMIIAAGSHAWINKYVLARPSFVFIGLISYPLYLLHWPPLALIKIVDPSFLTLTVKFLIIFACIILATLIYMFIEKPARQGGIKITIALFICMVIISFISNRIYRNKIQSRSAEDLSVMQIYHANNDWDGLNKELIPFKFKDMTFYRYGSDEEKILFFGDSNAEQYAPRMVKLINDNANCKSIIFATSAGRPPIPEMMVANDISKKDFVATIYELIKDPNISEIVIAASWVKYFDTDSYIVVTPDNNEGLSSLLRTVKSSSMTTEIGHQTAYKNFEQMIRHFLKLGKKVHLILNIPTNEKLCATNFAKRSFLGQIERLDPVVYKEEWLRVSASVTRHLKEIAARTGINVIDPVQYLCDNEVCFARTTEGKFMYRDFCHLSASYVRQHLKFLDHLIVRPIQ